MEIEIGDILIATRIYEIENGFTNGDIIQILKKHDENTYVVKIIYKENNKMLAGLKGWYLCAEINKFDKL